MFLNFIDFSNHRVRCISEKNTREKKPTNKNREEKKR